MQSNFLGPFILISAVCGGILACFPLYRFSKRMIWLCLPTILAILIGYLIWGGYFAFSDYQAKFAKEQEINALLASPEKTAQLIKRITAQLDDSPQSAAGWRLVGKLYLILHQENDAKEAFQKAARYGA
jgi:cytochrome c-type biogenesis protein CcmH